jgi:hypothetical protein
MFTAYLDPNSINMRIKSDIKEFILKVSNNQEAFFPSHTCTLWDNYSGKPVRVASGTYRIRPESIDLYHYPNTDVPNWVPGVLSAVTQFFGLGADPEIRNAIISVAIGITSKVFQEARGNLAEGFNGVPITNLAIHIKDSLLAGQFPADPNHPLDTPVWRLQLSGEPVSVDGEDWIIFGLQS